MHQENNETAIDESTQLHKSNEITRLREVTEDSGTGTSTLNAWLIEKFDNCFERATLAAGTVSNATSLAVTSPTNDVLPLSTRLASVNNLAKERRIHAVSPMQYQNGRFLNSLLQEAKISSSNSVLNMQNYGVDQEADAKLQRMIDNYQSQVLQQKMSGLVDREDVRSFPDPSLSASSVQQMPPMSHSQPCLINIAERRKDHCCRAGESAPPMYTPQSLEQVDVRENLSLRTKLLTAQQCLKTVQEENASVKQQCEILKKKANRLQQLESAYEAIEMEYDSLLVQNERQDNLEKAIRVKMESQISRLAAENDVLSEQVNQLSQRLQTDTQSNQLNKLNLILNEMIPQNKDLLACKERQKRDIQALEITLKEQRNHIQILEKALGNAQEKVWKKEKELEELSGNAERITSLQRAVEKSLMDKQRREEEWSRERAQLEMENAQLKMQLAKESASVGLKKSTGARGPDNEEIIVKLKKSLHVKEEKIISLEKNIIELESKFHEEMQRNKMAISTQSDTLSGKLKKMEEEKSEKDRKIAELTEDKEKLLEKLDEIHRDSENRIIFMEREIERLCNERRFRDDMARMEQMRLKIADRRCFTADRVRKRFNNHDRTSFGSRTSLCHNHMRTSSTSAILPSDISFPLMAVSRISGDAPLDLSSSGSLSKVTLMNNSIENDNDPCKTASIPDIYDGCRCSQPVDFSDNEILLSRFIRHSGHVTPQRNGRRNKEYSEKSSEEVWDV